MATNGGNLVIMYQMYGPDRKELQKKLEPTEENKKPMGYSWFPKDLTPVPISWVATSGNMVWFKRHEQGGHFAAMERPEELFEDVEEFVKVVFK